MGFYCGAIGSNEGGKNRANSLKNSEETRSLAKILKKYPNHDLKFWIINRIVLFDKKSSKEIKGILPKITSFGEDSEVKEENTKLKNVLKVAGPVAIGFAIGLL